MTSTKYIALENAICQDKIFSKNYKLPKYHGTNNLKSKIRFKREPHTNKGHTCMIQSFPCRQRSTPSQSKPMTNFFSGEGFRKSAGSCKGSVTMWIGTCGSLASCVSDLPPTEWNLDMRHEIYDNIHYLHTPNTNKLLNKNTTMI